MHGHPHHASEKRKGERERGRERELQPF